MNLTKKERYKLTKQDSLNYMDKRKLLLDEIRNEYKKISRKNSEGNINKKNFNNWMNLTKKERYNLSKQDAVDYMDKRKLLLDEIRNEYKKISRENSEENIKKK